MTPVFVFRTDEDTFQRHEREQTGCDQVDPVIQVSIATLL